MSLISSRGATSTKVLTVLSTLIDAIISEVCNAPSPGFQYFIPLSICRRSQHVAGMWHLSIAGRIRTHVELAVKLDKSPRNSSLSFAKHGFSCHGCIHAQCLTVRRMRVLSNRNARCCSGTLTSCDRSRSLRRHCCYRSYETLWRARFVATLWSSASFDTV